MVWYMGLASLLLLWASQAMAHELTLLDNRRPTPGLRLELTELPSTTTPASAIPRYRLRAFGLPRGVVFGVWARDFGHSFHEVATGFQMDGSGVMVSNELDSASWVWRWWRWLVKGQPRRLDEMALDPGPSYPRGAVWEVALASVDRTLTAFAKVIPHPITARDGVCTVSLELASRRGDRFVASGAGFDPGDEVITESRYSERIIQKRWRISPEGLLPPDVILHGASDADHSARYVVKGRSCNVAVEYEWGSPRSAGANRAQ
jgi:hypothetical protein